MARYPLHPRLSRLMVEARRRGVAATAVRWPHCSARASACPRARRTPRVRICWCCWNRSGRRMRRGCSVNWAGPPRAPRPRGGDEDALLLSVLTAFPDRVARRRQGAELQLASGAAAQQAPNSTVTGAELLVAVEAEDRKDQKAPVVRLASAIEPEWLLDLFPDRLREISTLEWNRGGERVEAVSSLMFDQIAIETRRTRARSRSRPAFSWRTRPWKRDWHASPIRRKSRPSNRASSSRRSTVPWPRWMPLPSKPRWHRWPPGSRASPNWKPPRAAAGLLRAIEQQMPPGTRRLLDEIAPAVHPSAARPAGAGPLRAQPAALDRLAPAGFLRHARDAHRGARRGPRGGAPAGAQSASGADDHATSPASGSASTRRFARNSRAATPSTRGRKIRSLEAGRLNRRTVPSLLLL